MHPPRLLRPSGLQSIFRHGHSLGAVGNQPCSAILPKIRGFHATAPRKAPSVHETISYSQELLCTLPHELFTFIHSSGLPWYAAIPAGALLVRGLLSFTVGLRVRRMTARLIHLFPLRYAMTNTIRDQLMKHGGYKSQKQAVTSIKRSVTKETRLLDERWGTGVWGHIGYTVGQLPIFLVMAETIRRMAATKDGLLMMTLRGLGLADGRSDTVTNAAIVNGEWVADTAVNPWFEPSMATEGTLWFENLLVPDPTGYLPFILSAVMFTNIYRSSNVTGNMPNPSKLSTSIRRLLLGLCLLIGPIGQSLPASLILYWISSTSMAFFSNALLDWRYPTPNNFGPTKRPYVLIPPLKGKKKLKI